MAEDKYARSHRKPLAGTAERKCAEADRKHKQAVERARDTLAKRLKSLEAAELRCVNLMHKEKGALARYEKGEQAYHTRLTKQRSRRLAKREASRTIHGLSSSGM